ncbi:menaquinone biosynthetic enzyme MqnA/MqnD family protein [soil metagenome]
MNEVVGHAHEGANAATPVVGERLGIVSYTNVAPLHWGLEPWTGAHFERGVPTELNGRLLAGDIDLTLVSSVEFIRHRDVLRALPDFSIATIGPVSSVMLFHRAPWRELSGTSIAVSSDSATSVALLEVLLAEDGITPTLVGHVPDLDAMLRDHDAALLIGDAALVESVARRSVHGVVPQQTDLGEAWYARTGLPFTFAVWAARAERPPSARLVAELRAARGRGLGHLAAVAASAAEALGLSPEVLLRYLANFRYFLEPPDRHGLEAFARRIDATCEPDQLRYWTL